MSTEADNGSPFTAAECKDLVRHFSVEHIRIRTYHPASNGLVERLHRSTREALADEELRTLVRARALIAAWVTEYKERRLRAGLGDLTPAEYDRGAPAARRAERTTKRSGHGRNDGGAPTSGCARSPDHWMGVTRSGGGKVRKALKHYTNAWQAKNSLGVFG